MILATYIKFLEAQSKIIKSQHQIDNKHIQNWERGRGRETADPDRGMDGDEIGVREEDLAGVDAELADFNLGELHLFPSFPFQ